MSFIKIKFVFKKVGRSRTKFFGSVLMTMIKSAAKNNFIDERKVVFETLMSFKRAGANAILTYYAKQIIDWLK